MTAYNPEITSLQGVLANLPIELNTCAAEIISKCVVWVAVTLQDITSVNIFL